MKEKPKIQEASRLQSEHTAKVIPAILTSPAFVVLKSSILTKFKATAIAENKELYRNLESLLLETQDSQNGIVTVYNNHADKAIYPTGRAIVRDATKALPFDQRISPDSAIVNSNNLLLRALGMVRGIDHALKDDQHKQRLKLIYEALLHTVINLQKELQQQAQFPRREGQNRENEIAILLKKLEVDFNSDLALFLNEVELAPNLSKPADYSALLLHYRYLATLLEPAPAVVTKIYDAKNNVVHTETSFPITTKTPDQLDALRVLGDPEGQPRSTANFHNQQKKAIQRANAAFSELALLEDRRFGAQARKNIAPTVKNGYIVRNEISFLDQQSSQTDWSARAGTIVYMGKGETDRQITEHAKQNLAQIHLNLVQLKSRNEHDENLSREMKIHATILVTYSPIEDQSRIVKHTEKATRKSGQASSYVPTNWDGTNRFNRIDDQVREAVRENSGNVLTRTISRLFGGLSVLSKPSNKKARLTQAAVLGALVNIGKKFLNLFVCASGQDRTGTAAEASAEYKTVAIYEQHGVPIELDDIQELRMRAGNATFLAHTADSGAPGLKRASKPAKFFKDEINAHTYLKSADTNKQAPLKSGIVYKPIADLNARAAWAKIHPEGKELLTNIDKYIRKLCSRGKWNPFMKRSQDKIAVMGALRNELKEMLSNGLYEPQEIRNKITAWESTSYFTAQGRVNTSLIISLHRNRFFNEIRYDQHQDRSEQTETQKFISDLKESLYKTVTLDHM